MCLPLRQDLALCNFARHPAVEDEGRLAAKMVAGIDRSLMRAIEQSVKQRRQFWKPGFRSAIACVKSVGANLERFKKLIGVVDKRLPPKMEFLEAVDQRQSLRSQPLRISTGES
ncbi:MAG: hypothetical protein ACFCD0_09700 [Gemmataceae bacterium]